MTFNKTNTTRLLTVLAVATSMFALTACNTTRGFGQDVEKVGEEIEESASGG